MKRLLLLTLLLLAGLAAGAQSRDTLRVDGHELQACMAADSLSAALSRHPGIRPVCGTVRTCLAGRYVKAAWLCGADAVVGQQDSIKTVILTARQPAEAGFSRIVVAYREDDEPVRLSLDGPGGESYLFEILY